MSWFRRRDKKGAERPPAFRRCPGCGYNFLTGEGRRRCSWYDCPYLPEDLKVFCPMCNYNFYTGEGLPHCSDPPTCEWAAEGLRRADAIRSAGRPAPEEG